ncbi:MAG: hypothetical protein U0704_16535 [Candidatus Eisenbacteria bacterium]
MAAFAFLGILTLVQAPLAHSAPWSVSISGAGGQQINCYRPTSRLGLEIAASRVISEGVGLGLELGAWEEIGARGFSYASFGPTGPDREHDRDAAMSALVRLGKRVGHARPHVLLGVGEYLTAHRQTSRDENTWTSPEYSPGFSVGVGISRSSMPTPVVAVRWHHVYTPSVSPHGVPQRTTDRLLVSAGVSFD